MEIERHKSKLKALFLGYLTRRFKRNYPINKCCIGCNKSIKGTIHRYEKTPNNNALIMYNSEDKNDKGMSSFSYYPISLAFINNDNYYCNHCYHKNKNCNKCSICLNVICKQILTKCGHVFCNSCLINWIKHDNKENVVFNATCPLCRQTI